MRGGALRNLLRDASRFAEGTQRESELRWATQPYVARPSGTERVEPRDTSVLLFPGQGAHNVGMGSRFRDFRSARDLYSLASSVVGWDVWRLCTEGPSEELERRCQTATLVTSLAALELIRETRPAALERARCAAGFSLGELSALVWGGSLPFEGALRLVQVREAAMRAAALERPSAMLTVWLGADATLPDALRQARDYAAENGIVDPVCTVANYLFPACKVVAGDEKAVAWLEREGRAFGLRRTARVRVAGAFHTALMRRAQDAVRAAVPALDVQAPALRVYCGAEARAYRDARHVRKGIVSALCQPVRWEQTLQAMYARARGEAMPLTLTLGPGAAVRASLRQVNARAFDASLQVEV